MKVTVCLGSSCHLKGSDRVVSRLEELIAEKGLSDRVELGGTFCIGKCLKGVCVLIDGKPCSVDPAETDAFFEAEILGRV